MKMSFCQNAWHSYKKEKQDIERSDGDRNYSTTSQGTIGNSESGLNRHFNSTFQGSMAVWRLRYQSSNKNDTNDFCCLLACYILIWQINIVTSCMRVMILLWGREILLGLSSKCWFFYKSNAYFTQIDGFNTRLLWFMPWYWDVWIW